MIVPPRLLAESYDDFIIVIVVIYRRLKTLPVIGPGESSKYASATCVNFAALIVKLQKINIKGKPANRKTRLLKFSSFIILLGPQLCFYFRKKRDNFQGQIFQYSLIHRC